MWVVGYRLALAEVARLPDGEELYDYYLGELERILAGKEWEYLSPPMFSETPAVTAYRSGRRHA